MTTTWNRPACEACGEDISEPHWMAPEYRRTQWLHARFCDRVTCQLERGGHG